MRSEAAIQALLKRTRSRKIQYICRAWLSFGEASLSAQALAMLDKALARPATIDDGFEP